MTNPADGPLPRQPEAPVGSPTEFGSPASYPPAEVDTGTSAVSPVDESFGTFDPTASEAAIEAQTTAPAQTGKGLDQRGRVKPTKVSGVWIGLIATALFVILLVIFIAQNSRRIPLHFFGWSGHFNLALTILIAAVVGVLVVSIPGSIRIIQLRRALRKNAKRG